MKIISIILCILIFMSCNPEKELYILPSNFRGTVFVIFNVKDGEPKTYSSGFRVYRIPDNGVLFTQFDSNTGEFPIGDIQYRYIKDKDTLNIKEHLITKDSTSVSSQIFMVRTGVFGEKEKYEYMSFFVYTYKEWQDFKNSNGAINDDPTTIEIIQQRLIEK